MFNKSHLEKPVGGSSVDIADTIAHKHDRSHSITSTSDHTSSATSGQVLKADASGLPVDIGTKQANMVFAGPISGANANPEFRALVTADIPLSAGGYAGSYLFCEDELFPLTVPPWRELETQSDGGSVGSHTVTTGNNTWVETDRYVTAALNSTILPGGNWKFIIYAKGSIIDKQFQLKSEIYRVDSTGTIVGTVLGTATSSTFMGTSVVGIRSDCFISTQTGWAVTDRVGVIVYGRRTENEGTLTWYHDKTQGWVSEVTTPISLLHNQMNGLNQGDYQHLNAVQVAALHPAVTVSAPISVSTQALSLVNDAAATITEIDTGALANSDTVIPTSKAVTTSLAAKLNITSLVLPFYTAAGTLDTIPLTADQKLPFYIAAGTTSNIPLTA
jgi:hypothetical protein